MKNPDKQGFYGEFGGAFVPEMLYPNVAELQAKYLEILAQVDFQQELQQLLHAYAGRPSPLYYSGYLSAKYGGKIYLKREDLNHTGAHKINNALGQILLAARMGKKEIIAETGAGQHGVATATAAALMGMPCKVFMGEVDMARQAPNVARMRMLGAEVVAATSGSRTLKDATNEAIRYWINNPEAYYLIGSVVGPHPYPDLVARLQAVISAELLEQVPAQTGRPLPDKVVACIGGGSNAAGAFYHYIEQPDVQLIAVEAGGKGIASGQSAATSQLGSIGIIHGSRTLLMQDADGQIIEPYSISAGLDYPGIGPMHAHLISSGRAQVYSINDDQALAAGVALSRHEGILPALESAHALAVLPELDIHPDDITVVCLSGRGDKDLQTYLDYLHIND